MLTQILEQVEEWLQHHDLVHIFSVREVVTKESLLLYNCCIMQIMVKLKHTLQHLIADNVVSNDPGLRGERMRSCCTSKILPIGVSVKTQKFW